MAEAMSVLAIGVDAAEPTFVRQLIADGSLPALQQLARESEWRRVQSPAHVGSGAVWPTFMTAAGPERHGVYAEWAWRPDRMGVERYSGAALRPFWSDWTTGGRRVGMLDVPFAPLLGMRDGFEITEWGPHDAFDGRCSAQPAGVVARVSAAPVHPFYAESIDPAGPEDAASLQALASACRRGATLRGDLAEALMQHTRPSAALIVFPELHHASHYFWHGVAPEAPVYRGRAIGDVAAARQALVDIWTAVDRQIGRLIDAAGDPPTVAVFSLHGMQPATGISAVLGPALLAAGFARLSGWQQQSWRDRGASAFAALKRRSPAFVKRLYYRSVPATTTRMLAGTTMLPAYDWGRTRAFALPSDQHGWVRVNLCGREAQGLVRADEYDSTCTELETFVHSLRDEAGQTLVRSVHRTAMSAEEARTSRLPDLIVHWEDAALASPLRLREPRLTVEPIGRKYTGQHAFDGFCLWRSARALPAGDVDATSLSARLTDAL